MSSGAIPPLSYINTSTALYLPYNTEYSSGTVGPTGLASPVDIINTSTGEKATLTVDSTGSLTIGNTGTNFDLRVQSGSGGVAGTVYDSVYNIPPIEFIPRTPIPVVFPASGATGISLTSDSIGKLNIFSPTLGAGATGTFSVAMPTGYSYANGETMSFTFDATVANLNGQFLINKADGSNILSFPANTIKANSLYNVVARNTGSTPIANPFFFWFGSSPFTT